MQLCSLVRAAVDVLAEGGGGGGVEARELCRGFGRWCVDFIRLQGHGKVGEEVKVLNELYKLMEYHAGGICL